MTTIGGAFVARGSGEREGRGELIRRMLLWGWVCLVVLYFAWEAVAYRGLFAIAAEWQFDHIGQDLPTFTFGLLTMLCAWPALILFRRKRHPMKRDDAAAPGSAEDMVYLRALERHDSETAIDVGLDYMHFMFGFASALVFAMLAALVWTLTLPTMTGKVRDVSITQEVQPDGPARLIGMVNYGRIASFSRGILFLRHSELYAPVLAPEGREGLVHYFVEFSPWERSDIHNGGTLTHRTGILVRADLPGAMVRLYRYLGYHVAPHYYVLYSSAFTIRWPYYLIAIQFALGAVVFLILALLQRRHVRRVVRAYDDNYGAVVPA